MHGVGGEVTSENVASGVALHFILWGAVLVYSGQRICCAPFSDFVLHLPVTTLPDDPPPLLFLKEVVAGYTKAPRSQ